MTGFTMRTEADKTLLTPKAADSHKAEALPQAKSHEPKDGFYPAPAPFGDYCFVSAASASIRGKLLASFAALGLVSRELPGYVYAGSSPYAENLLSGYGETENHVFYGNERVNVPFREALYGSGDYVWFLLTEHYLVGCADFYGHASLFYYQDEEMQAVSNRRQLISLAATFSPKRSLNLPFIKTAALAAPAFARGLLANDSPIRNLGRLAHNQFVVLERGHLCVFERPRQPTGKPLAQLLREARNDTRRFIAGLRPKLCADRLDMEPDASKEGKLNLAAFEGLAGTCASSRENCSKNLLANRTIACPGAERIQPVSPEEGLRAARSYSSTLFEPLWLPTAATRGMANGATIKSWPENVFEKDPAPMLPLFNLSREEWLDYNLNTHDCFYPFLPDLQDKTDIREYLISRLAAFVGKEDGTNARLLSRARLEAARNAGGNRLLSLWADGLSLYLTHNKALYDAFLLDAKQAGRIYDAYGEKGQSGALPCRGNSQPQSVPPAEADGAKSERQVLEKAVAEALARLMALEPALEKFFLQLHSQFHSDCVKKSRYAIAANILGLDDILHPLASLKAAALPAELLAKVVMPISGVKITPGNVAITLFSDYDASLFQYGLYLNARHKLIGRFDYQDSPVFNTSKWAGFFDNVVLFLKTRQSEPIYYMARRWIYRA